MRYLQTLLLLVAGLAAAMTVSAASDNKERAEYIRSHYAKYEYQVPMRDGTPLFTSVYVPYDQSKKHPILMQRTPYRVAPYGVDEYKTRLGPSEDFEKAGYIFVFQDVRGKQMSEGKFVNMRPQNAYQKGSDAVDDATDTYDTVEWLVNNIPNNNGNVGQWGISYPGYYTSVAGINSHKALKAISPQAPIADWFFDDFHRNGAFSTPMAFIFFDSFDKPHSKPYAHWAESEHEVQTPDGYQFFHDLGALSNVNKLYFKGERPFWTELTEHPNYDEYWQERNVLQHLNDVKPAVLVVGGWYDTEDLYGPLATYQTMSKNNTRDNVQLVMGPWYHGQWIGEGDHMGQAQMGFDTSIWFRKNVLFPFFQQHLNPDSEASYKQKVTVFETGANRWRYLDQWPPAQGKNTTFYFNKNEILSDDKPGADGGYSWYISDPNKPVPHSAEVSRGWDRPYMAEDQRFTERRTDVVVFETDTMESDMTIAGPVNVDLWVSTTKKDADFVIKIVDVFPSIDENDNEKDGENGNRHELVRWGIIRGRFRDSFSEPKPFEPGKPTQVSFELYDLLHDFKRGHKLQIQVQSSIFPFLDMNPQKWVDNIYMASDDDFEKAEHHIYHDAAHPSALSFKVIK